MPLPKPDHAHESAARTIDFRPGEDADDGLLTIGDLRMTPVEADRLADQLRAAAEAGRALLGRGVRPAETDGDEDWRLAESLNGRR